MQVEKVDIAMEILKHPYLKLSMPSWIASTETFKLANKPYPSLDREKEFALFTVSTPKLLILQQTHIPQTAITALIHCEFCLLSSSSSLRQSSANYL
jgi:hypothetical protein